MTDAFSDLNCITLKVLITLSNVSLFILNCTYCMVTDILCYFSVDQTYGTLKHLIDMYTSQQMYLALCKYPKPTYIITILKLLPHLLLLIFHIPLFTSRSCSTSCPLHWFLCTICKCECQLYHATTASYEYWLILSMFSKCLYIIVSLTVFSWLDGFHIIQPSFLPCYLSD